MKYRVLTDEQLISRLRSGDQLAFAQIHERYYPLLYNFSLKKNIDPEEIKDMIQEVFIKLWQNRESIQLTTSLRSYLFRSVWNRMMDLFRHTKIKQEHIDSLQTAMNSPGFSGTDYRIREKDMERIITLEIEALPQRMREVLTLRRDQNLSNKEIGIQLGITEQTVETHAKRALRVLRRRLVIRVLLLLVHV
ncbi:RNA polymerase sigma-70 factor [Chitinophaga sp. CC14]|uniref:RNA polymerase sigma factor n=1 Tax=Chitinophaga sp. CC14 TaxID=3029199 RepID=UPI003B7D4BA7